MTTSVSDLLAILDEYNAVCAYLVEAADAYCKVYKIKGGASALGNLVSWDIGLEKEWEPNVTLSSPHIFKFTFRYYRHDDLYDPDDTHLVLPVNLGDETPLQYYARIKKEKEEAYRKAKQENQEKFKAQQAAEKEKYDLREWKRLKRKYGKEK